jgi:hypothetical protein
MYFITSVLEPIIYGAKQSAAKDNGLTKHAAALEQWKAYQNNYFRQRIINRGIS